MNNVSAVFEKLLLNEDFRKNYLLIYLDRFVYNTTDLETGLTSEERKIAIESLLAAFNYLMEIDSERLSPIDIASVGNFVNSENGIEGFRKVEVTAGKYANWKPCASRNIYYNIYSLLDNYYNVWKDRTVYEREAAFHIYLMRMHPFEDGNKRAAKILMNANFVKQNHPPVIITESDTLQYYNFINTMDIDGFAKFLKERSLQELNIMMSFYKAHHNIPIENSVVDKFGNDSGGRK